MPLYEVIIEGTDDKGNKVKHIFQATRFMPYWKDPKDPPHPNYKTEGWVNSGLSSERDVIVTLYDEMYETHNRYSPDGGAFQITANFMLHAGPSSPSDDLWGAAGCVEICGDFGDFKDNVANLTGSVKKTTPDKLLDAVKAGKIRIKVQSTPVPQIIYKGE